MAYGTPRDPTSRRRRRTNRTDSRCLSQRCSRPTPERGASSPCCRGRSTANPISGCAACLTPVCRPDNRYQPSDLLGRESSIPAASLDPDLRCSEKSPSGPAEAACTGFGTSWSSREPVPRHRSTSCSGRRKAGTDRRGQWPVCLHPHHAIYARFMWPSSTQRRSDLPGRTKHRLNEMIRRRLVSRTPRSHGACALQRLRRTSAHSVDSGFHGSGGSANGRRLHSRRGGSALCHPAAPRCDRRLERVRASATHRSQRRSVRKPIRLLAQRC